MKQHGEVAKRPTGFYFWAFILFVCVSIAVGEYRNIDFNETIIVFEKSVVIFIIVEFVLRIVMFLECIIKGRFTGGIIETTKQIFSLNNYSLIISVIILSHFFYKDPKLINKLLVDIAVLACAYFFTRFIKLDESAYLNSIRLENCNGLDYGSGMAYSFFHGYLNIILPDKGDENDSTKLLMEKYEALHRVKFGTHKLIILVPKCLYCPPDISEWAKKGSVKMEACRTLLNIERNRAGVQKRIYKNSVYKVIRDSRSEPIYFVVEGATPLQTLYESLKTASVHQKSYKDNQEIIVSQFYRTIKTLVEESPECRDVCEIVYYDNDNIENVGQFLLDMLK